MIGGVNMKTVGLIPKPVKGKKKTDKHKKPEENQGQDKESGDSGE